MPFYLAARLRIGLVTLKWLNIWAPPYNNMYMTEKNIIAESTRDLISLLPVRRSQASNWAIRLLPLKKPFIGTLFGSKSEIHPLEAASRAAYFTGLYEREITIWFIDYLKKNKPKIIFDVGANFGYSSYIAEAYSPHTKVVSFEPDPYNYEWLKRNLALIGNKNLSAEQLAISDKTGTLTFLPSNPDSHSNLWATVKLDDTKVENEISVKAVSLDEYCAERNIISVDLVKMDIEGGEGFAVDGMTQGIKDGLYKAALIELHPDILKKGTYSLESIAQKFLQYGYKGHYFNSSFNNNVDDLVNGYYDLSWKDSYLQNTLPTSDKLSEWEHVLFTR